MINVRLYDTPNRLSYVGYDYNKKIRLVFNSYPK